LTAKTAQPTDDPAQAAQAGTPEPRRRVSWRLLLAAAAGMLVAGLAVAHAPFVRSAVARAIVSRVGSGLDTVLALDRLDYNLLTLRFTGTGLSLTAKGSPGPAYFRADRVTVRLRPSALLGHLRFASVELIHPSFTAAREEGGDSICRTPGLRRGPLRQSKSVG
jgi:hypothetical protein